MAVYMRNIPILRYCVNASKGVILQQQFNSYIYETQIFSHGKCICSRHGGHAARIDRL